MFQLTSDEAENLRFQIGISSSDFGGRRYLPYAFTEQGVAMLSSVLRSKRAVLVNIAVSRLAIVFNGSPLFTGDAGGGESEIRPWIIENDWLEAIVALPEQLFYNTGISTYLWVLTNRKDKSRKEKVQLIDARPFWVQMEKSLGNKRRRIGDPSDEKTRKARRTTPACNCTSSRQWTGSKRWMTSQSAASSARN